MMPHGVVCSVEIKLHTFSPKGVDEKSNLHIQATYVRVRKNPERTTGIMCTRKRNYVSTENRNTGLQAHYISYHRFNIAYFNTDRDLLL